MTVQEIDINLPPDELGEPLMRKLSRIAEDSAVSKLPTNTPEPSNITEDEFATANAGD